MPCQDHPAAQRKVWGRSGAFGHGSHIHTRPCGSGRSCSAASKPTARYRMAVRCGVRDASFGQAPAGK
eukprot:scaffold124103_cov78-Phaeocystis_antarctica.AAC.1